MSAYTVSQLAHNAGVSVHIVRDYLVRGLLRPVACTTGGYGVVRFNGGSFSFLMKREYREISRMCS